MIRAELLSKNYGKTKAINQLTFNLNKGQITALLGVNGAGKSTTLNILTGYLTPTSGNLWLGNYAMADNPIEAKRLLGYLPEQPPLYLDFTVEEYLHFVAKLKNIDKQRAKTERDKLYTLTGLGSVYKRLIKNLSKGYKQRIGLAAALVGFPPILILDEPTSGLDPEQIQEIGKLIASLRGEHTILLSSHILSEVEHLADQLLILSKGNLMANDSVANLSAKIAGGGRSKLTVITPNHQIIADALGNIAGISRVEHNFAEEENTHHFNLITTGHSELRSQIFKTIVACNGEIIDFNSSSLSLEEIFFSFNRKP
jgi:ABC-2 type transport system ATP-binding protein